MQKIIQSSRCVKKSHFDSHWRKATQMWPLQVFSHYSSRSRISYYEAHSIRTGSLRAHGVKLHPGETCWPNVFNSHKYNMTNCISSNDSNYSTTINKTNFCLFLCFKMFFFLYFNSTLLQNRRRSEATGGSEILFTLLQRNQCWNMVATESEAHVRRTWGAREAH